MASEKFSLSAWLRRNRRMLDIFAMFFWVGFFLAPYLMYRLHVSAPIVHISLGPLRAIDSYFADELARNGRLTPPNPDIVFLGIDDASERLDTLDPDLVRRDPALNLMSKPWPWQRQVHALILDRLCDAGARVVIFDLLFLAPNSGDDALKASLDRHADRVIIGCNLVPLPNRPKIHDLPDMQPAYPANSIIPQTNPPDQRIAFVNFWPDVDGSIRQARFHYPYAGAALGEVESTIQLDSLAAKTLHLLGRDDLVPTDEAQHPIRFTGGGGSFDTYSVYQLFDPHTWKNNFRDGAFFKGKIVMVGPKGNFQQDQHLTPFGGMDGADIHLQAINAAMNGEYLFKAADHLGWMIFLVGGAGLFAWMIGLAVPRVATQAGCAVVIGVAYILVATPVFDHRIVLAAAAPLGTLFFTMLTTLTGQYLMEQLERTRTRKYFERYVSSKVVGEILDNPAGYVASLGGRRRELTVLFSDLRGFTSMTENADSVQLVSELNEYLREMTHVLSEHDGILDKFIGDAVMAMWGSFTPKPEQDARNAVLTALGMHRALDALNIRRRERGLADFAMGVGINHGEAIVGDIGSEQQTNFTAIGDSVNLASRLESATKEYGVDTLISESMATLVRPFFHLQTVDLVQVKGRKKPVEVFTVHGTQEENLPAERIEYLQRFEAAMKDYRGEKFAEARAGFAACRKLFPDDSLARLFELRSEQFESTPPPQPWDGVYVMTKK